MMHGKRDENGKFLEKGAGKFLRNLLGFALALAGCASPVSAPHGGPGGGGLGTVRVEVSGLGPQVPVGPQRAAYPTPPVTSELTYFYIWKMNDVEVTPPPALVGSTFTLAVGDYTLDVEAYVGDKDPDNLVGTGVGKVDGQAIITVNRDADLTVMVELEPVTGTGTGTGRLDYTIKYPEGTTVVSLTLQKLGDMVEVNLTPTGASAIMTTGIKEAVSVGDYLLRVTLVNSAGVAGMSEIVHIYRNMTTTVPDSDASSASFVFAVGDFTPGDMVVTGGWTDGYTVAQGGGLIKSITLKGKTVPILIGRKADEQVILKINSGGNLQFRDAVRGSIPIGSYAEFQLISTASGGLDGAYRQEADLDLMGNAAEWTAVGSTASYRFTGTFDGGGKAISNLYINKPDSNYQGLFGYVDGTVQNVRIASGSVTGGAYFGGVVGINYGTITACSNSAAVTSPSGGCVGGVVGENYGTITACSNSGAVSGFINDIGGVVGWMHPGVTVTACSNTGVVSGDANVGGVAGRISNNSAIIACSNTAAVSASARLSNLGGVAGYLDGSVTVIACYNSGAVSGNEFIGGVVGRNWDTDITACYNIGAISGVHDTRTGLVVGDLASGSVLTCYWTGYSDGFSPSSSGSTEFGAEKWPSVGTGIGKSNEWGTGNGSGSGKYWKNLGDWNGGNPVYPKLYWEE